MLSLLVIVIVAGCVWFAVSKILAVVLGVVLLYGWGKRQATKQVHRTASRRMMTEGDRYKRSRLITRSGLPEGKDHFPGKVQQHGDLHDMGIKCDGWCDGKRKTQHIHKRREQKLPGEFA
jgi:hypothetical protein